MDYLDQLESQTIYIIREAYSRFRNTCLLWSIGKDSTTLLWIARKAFFGKIPFIKYEDIDKVEKECLDAGLKTGTSGPRLRTTTTCPGNNWCKRGLIDTFALYTKIEEQGIECALDLPHKFKIVISGCANACTRAESSEIGIHGAVDMSSGKPRFGYTVYLGGCGGKTPRFGIKLDKVYSDEEVLGIIERVVNFFKDHAKPRQRLALLIEEIGKEAFLKAIGIKQKAL